MALCQNLVPLVNIKIAGKWMFIPLKMVLIGIDPYPYEILMTHPDIIHDALCAPATGSRRVCGTRDAGAQCQAGGWRDFRVINPVMLPWKSMENPWKSMKIHENLWKIHENPWKKRMSKRKSYSKRLSQPTGFFGHMLFCPLGWDQRGHGYLRIG